MSQVRCCAVLCDVLRSCGPCAVAGVPQADLGYPYPLATLDVFTGTTVSSLTTVTTSAVCPTRVSGGYHSCATLNGTAGTTYYFRVDGPGAAVGPATLQVDMTPYCSPGMGHLQDRPNDTCTVCPEGRTGPDLSNGCAPVNDNFQAAIPVVNGVTYNGTTEGGTWEATEPAASGGGTITSVWYKFDAMSGGSVTVRGACVCVCVMGMYGYAQWRWVVGCPCSFVPVPVPVPVPQTLVSFLLFACPSLPCPLLPTMRRITMCWTRCTLGTVLVMVWWTCSLAHQPRLLHGLLAPGTAATRRLWRAQG